MRLVVLGATGELESKSFSRPVDGLKRFAGQIIVKQGDLLNSAALADAIKGHEAVLSGFANVRSVTLSSPDESRMRTNSSVRSSCCCP